MICNTLLGVDKHFFSSVSFWQLVANNSQLLVFLYDKSVQSNIFSNFACLYYIYKNRFFNLWNLNSTR